MIYHIRFQSYSNFNAIYLRIYGNSTSFSTMIHLPNRKYRAITLFWFQLEELLDHNLERSSYSCK